VITLSNIHTKHTYLRLQYDVCRKIQRPRVEDADENDIMSVYQKHLHTDGSCDIQLPPVEDADVNRRTDAENSVSLKLL
jgi:hypothetical protein